MGQSEGRQPADPEALVLPGQHVVGQVDFLVNHGELYFRVLTCNHLGREKKQKYKLKPNLCRLLKVVKGILSLVSRKDFR